MKCKHDRCDEIPLSLAEFCWNHLPDKESYLKKVLDRIAKGEDLAGYNLQRIVLKNAHVEKASLRKVNLSLADLSGSRFFDSKLDGAELVGSTLADCDFTHCGLKGADFIKADLANSRIWNSDLSDANLTESNLTGVDFWNSKLFNVKLWHAALSGVRSLSMRSFCGGRNMLESPRINEAGLLSAKESYRQIKGYFLSQGMYDDASWASFKEKGIERLIFRKNGNLNYIPSVIMNVLCGYGEKPYRIILSAASTIIFFALLYYSLGAIELAAAPSTHLKLPDYIYYSVVTFTTVGYGDIIPKAHSLFRMLAAAEAFCGVFLTGLFIFTLARKYSAR